MFKLLCKETKWSKIDQILCISFHFHCYNQKVKHLFWHCVTLSVFMPKISGIILWVIVQTEGGESDGEDDSRDRTSSGNDFPRQGSWSMPQMANRNRSSVLSRLSKILEKRNLVRDMLRGFRRKNGTVLIFHLGMKKIWWFISYLY